jgi:hypothetical protein
MMSKEHQVANMAGVIHHKKAQSMLNHVSVVLCPFRCFRLYISEVHVGLVNISGGMSHPK